MKKIGKILLWIFAVFGFLVFILIIIVANQFPLKKKIKIKPDTYLELCLNGTHHDYNEYSDMYFIEENLSLEDIRSKLKSAERDSRIKGIIIKPQFYSAGWAFTYELKNILEDFKTSGKKIYSYINLTIDKGYYLASVADSIFLNPSISAGIALSGIGAEISYYKGFFDKIGIEFTVLHQGRYKGTGEIYSRETMSKAFQESFTNIIDEFYKYYTKGLSQSRKISSVKVKQILEKRNQFLISGQRALDYLLVDKLIYENDFTDSVIKNNPIVNIRDYTELDFRNAHNKIAIIYAQGNMILSNSGGIFGNLYRRITEHNIPQEIDRIKRMKTVKALVLRVNSGGGSALVAEKILHKLKDLKKKMPIVVSMGNVAGSGGYMISCIADYIFAEPNTLTGSIGVVSMIPNWQDLREWAKINTYKIKKGKFTSYFSPNFKPTNADKESLILEMEKIYNSFKLIVAKNRNLSLEQVEDLAQGRVWTGEEAVKNGLVDELGGLQKAIKKASELSGMDKYSLLILPIQKNILDFIQQKGFLQYLFLKFNFDVNYFTKVLSDNIKKHNNLINSFLYEPVQVILPFKYRMY